MKYKMIALDMDGTLTNDNKDITLETLNKLKELARKGMKIVLASGRPLEGLLGPAKDLEFDQTGGFLLAYNGGKIVDYKTNEIIHQNTIQPALAKEVDELIESLNIGILTYEGGKIVASNQNDQYVIEEGRINKMEIREVANFNEFLVKPVNKLLCTGDPDYLASKEEEVKQAFANQLAIYRSQPFFLEVNPLGVDKAASLQKLCDHLGITKEEVIAFGDGYNDFSMIEFSGYGVVMENGVKELKDISDYVTKSNNDDGVAYALNYMEEAGLL